MLEIRILIKNAYTKIPCVEESLINSHISPARPDFQLTCYSHGLYVRPFDAKLGARDKVYQFEFFS